MLARAAAARATLSYAEQTVAALAERQVFVPAGRAANAGAETGGRRARRQQQQRRVRLFNSQSIAQKPGVLGPGRAAASAPGAGAPAPFRVRRQQASAMTHARHCQRPLPFRWAARSAPDPRWRMSTRRSLKDFTPFLGFSKVRVFSCPFCHPRLSLSRFSLHHAIRFVTYEEKDQEVVSQFLQVRVHRRVPYKLKSRTRR